MAAYKFTIQRGKVDLKDVVVALGTNEAQSDTLSVNIDVTNASRGEVIHMLDEVQQKILGGPWPPL